MTPKPQSPRAISPGRILALPACRSTGADGGRPEANPLVPQLRLDERLTELQVRLQDILDTRDRTHALLEAVVAVGGHFDLEVVLGRIVEAAVTLVTPATGRWA
jgi:hypothetical protein